jgi:uncharacterized protein YjbI with pentapeptide repeats
LYNIPIVTGWEVYDDMPDRRALELLQEERIDQFNALVDAANGEVDLTNAHLRAYDLRKCHLSKANLRGAYMRATDLRGVDLSQAKLDGASLKEAKVSGVSFPRNLSAQELMMSFQHGTRLRHDT